MKTGRGTYTYNYDVISIAGQRFLSSLLSCRRIDPLLCKGQELPPQPSRKRKADRSMKKAAN
jgi:hypothetical protein